MSALSSTDDVVEYLSEVAERSDRGALPEMFGVFARAYLRVTLEIIARCADDFFQDPSWVAAFDVRFANKYKDAIEDAPSRPRCWQIAHDVAAGGGKDVLRHLMLGINAHMRYDLTVVLLGGFVDDRVARKRDFDAVNNVMKLAIDPIQSVVEDRYIKWLRTGDDAVFALDEILTYKRFFTWRSRAWVDAMAILDGRLDLRDVDARVSRMAQVMKYTPGLLLAALPF